MTNFSEDMKKYIVIVNLNKDILANTTVIEKNQIDKPDIGSDNKCPWSLLSPQKLDTCQRFYEDKSEEWYNSKSNLWNFTVNPDLMKLPPAQRNNLSVKRYLWKHVKKIVKSPLISFAIEEIIIYWEWGEKNGKLHCNICMKIDPKEDPRCVNYLLDKFTVLDRFVRNGFKDHKKKFKRPDIYNMKDAQFMTKLGHPPIHLVNKHKMILAK